MALSSQGQRPVIILSLSDGSNDNFLTASLLGWGGSRSQPVSEMEEETVELQLWDTEGTDICSRLWFEFTNSQILSEDSIINIERDTRAPMNTKVLFAFSGGFSPKSIRKICTLHQYEFENLTAVFFTYSTLAKTLNSRLTYSYRRSFYLVNDLSP